MKREIKTTLALDGEKEFKQAVSEINRELKVLGTEMDKVTAEFGDNAKGMEALASKQKVYNKQIDEQKKKIEELKRALANSEQEFGKNDRRTKEWQISLNRAEASLVKMERSLESNNKELEKASNKMEQFSRKANEMGQNLKSIGDKMTGAGRTMSMAVTAPIVAAGVASFKFAADLEDAQGAADQIFKNSSKEIQSWADGLKSHYGIAETEALTYANTMGAMLQNIGGLSEAEAAKMSGQLVELAGDLTAMFGGTTESAVNALTGALKGNNSMLDNYGMGVNEATIKAKALEMGLIKGKEAMTLQAKQAATLALIMEQTGAAQGQAAREAEGASGSMRAFSTEMKNLSTAFGEHLLPAITPFISKLNELIKSFSELSPATQKTIIAAAGIAAALGPVMTVVGNLMKVIGGVIGIGGKLITAITRVIGIGGKLITAITRIGPIIAGLATPVGIAVAAVVALIAIFAKLWQTSPKFRNWVRGLADSLENGLKGAINSVVDQLNWLIEKINKLPGIEINTVGKMTKSSGTSGWADFRQLPGNAEGTRNWTGGWTMVGEKGAELAWLPRGTDIRSHGETNRMINQSLTIGGTVRVEGVNDMGQLVGVTKIVAKEIEQGDRRLPGRVRVMPSMA